MAEPKTIPGLCITTKPIPEPVFKDTVKRKFIEIFKKDGSWDINTISMLLNELPEYKVKDKMRIREKEDGTYLVFLFASDDDVNQMKISLKIAKSIRVKLTTSTVMENWNEEISRTTTDVGSCGRKLKRPKNVQARTFTATITSSSEGSRVLYENLSVIFYNTSSFSQVFLYFCKKVCKRISCFGSEDISTFRDIYETWMKNVKYISTTT